MKQLCIALVCGAVLVASAVQPAVALPPFKGEFQKKYVDSSESDDFKAAFKSASCYTCHVKGTKDKKKLNDYGHELHEALEESGESPKKLLKSDKAKLLELLAKAFETVSKKKSKEGPTFGELIEKGKLPAFKEIKEVKE
jgi:hypothetical protein